MPQAQFYIGSALLFIGSLLTESAAIAILAKVIHPKMKKGFLNAGLLSGIGDTIGRALGNISFTIFSRIDTTAAYPGIWYIVATCLIALCILLNLIFIKILQKFTIIKIEDVEVQPKDKVNNNAELIPFGSENNYPEH